ncbi:MAG TPA: YHS domain-containing protein [Deltaproteobacteria bacterium]|nr:YHS domain-containing protein [Deltaproteobacteria bacterium]
MIFRLLFAIGIVYLAYRIGKKLFLPVSQKKEEFPPRPAPIESEDMVRDPVCGTYVPLGDAHKTTVNGKTLYFCSETCCETYKKRKSMH